MSQQFCQINVYGDVWHIDTTLGISQAAVYALVAVPLAWQDGASDVIVPHKRLTAQATGAFTVDMTTTDYLIVAVKGVGLAQLVPIAQLLNLPTLYAGQTWAVLGVVSRSGPRAWEQ